MRLKKCGDKLFLTDGLGQLIKDEERIEIIDAVGDERLNINGESIGMKNGVARVAVTLIGDGLVNLKLYSGGAWYVLEGILCEDGCLRFNEDYLSKYLVGGMMALHELEVKNRQLLTRVEALERLCSGEDFL